MAQVLPLDCNGETLRPGQIVWCEGVVGFPGECMKAEVLDQHPDDHGNPQAHYEFARHGKVLVRDCYMVKQLPTPAAPVPAHGWVTAWPARAILGL